jgi:hypothetical protein
LGKLRAQQNLIKNWISIVLTVLSLIQGFAFNYWATQLNAIYEQVRDGNYFIGVHFILCFFILVRVYQTFLAAVLDYDFLLPRSFEMLLISTIGIAEFFLFSSIREEQIKIFSPTSFHKRGILLCLMATLGYTTILRRLVKQRDQGTKRNLIPFKRIPQKGRHKLNKKGGKFQMIRATTDLRLFTYKKPEDYWREVLLQEVNIVSLLVIIAIEILIILSNSGRRKLIAALVIVIIAILCSNVFYSTRITFGRREKPSKPRPS